MKINLIAQLKNKKEFFDNFVKGDEKIVYGGCVVSKNILSEKGKLNRQRNFAYIQTITQAKLQKENANSIQ